MSALLVFGQKAQVGQGHILAFGRKGVVEVEHPALLRGKIPGGTLEKLSYGNIAGRADFFNTH